MHELSIALSLLDVAAEAAARLGHPSVAAIHVRVGPLSGVVADALVSAYELAREGTPFAATRLEVEAVPVVVHCPACDAERTPTALQDLRCPSCGGPARVVRGRELEVVALEVPT